MVEKLGYGTPKQHGMDMSPLVDLYKKGASSSAILKADIQTTPEKTQKNRLFPNVDGLRFLTHQGGCGGIRQDSEALCRLLAGYIANPNVAGATVLSLGCQNAQFEILDQAIKEINEDLDKPVIILEQQQSRSEKAFIEEAIKKTFVGMMEANHLVRQPAPLSKIVLGLECGGSDGFSGITANPALGHTSDMLVALGGTTILSEFPELNGVEQELINRCTDTDIAKKFARLMSLYSQRAVEAGSGFDMNPSPGNIKDGLITDAMKSAGAAKKGGTSPVTAVLDYTEQATQAGLNLLCTPGNDVESTTGLAGSGANMIVFTTGLGTPTGNPISPTIKFSSNTMLYDRMEDIIDLDAGTIVSGEDNIESKGTELLDLIIKIASGKQLTKAERLDQNDFIPWKRGISL
jgi:altronate hydrolase